jgi:hypothetical protein
MPSENRSMCRDLFRAFARWCGFMHQEEIKEGFLSHAEVKEGFVPRAEAKKRLERFIPMPLKTKILTSATHGTSILRTWRTEDVKVCKLCPKCTAVFVGEDPADKEYAFCLIWAPGEMEWQVARLYQVPPEKPAK